MDMFTWEPGKARLDKQGKVNAWTAGHSDQSQWLQVQSEPRSCCLSRRRSDEWVRLKEGTASQVSSDRWGVWFVFSPAEGLALTSRHSNPWHVQ